MTASVLVEGDVEHTTEGRLILGAAVLDDGLGLLLLSAMVTALSTSRFLVAPVVGSFERTPGLRSGLHERERVAMCHVRDSHHPHLGTFVGIREADDEQIVLVPRDRAVR